jgi:hypothetical protein
MIVDTPAVFAAFLAVSIKCVRRHGEKLDAADLIRRPEEAQVRG